MNISEKLRLSIDYELPCGHHLIQADRGGDTVRDKAEKLIYWLNERLPRHRCELVSEANPNGIEPKHPNMTTNANNIRG